MKTKEEVIKEAWGRYWNEVKSNVIGMGINGGWADNDVIHYNEDLGCDSKDFEFSGTLYRPKSISGIETNNGWIRIESEDDLPKEPTFCYYVRKSDGGMSIGVVDETDINRVTHYQPIVKPKPPIY